MVFEKGDIVKYSRLTVSGCNLENQEHNQVLKIRGVVIEVNQYYGNTLVKVTWSTRATFLCRAQDISLAKE